MPEPLSGLRRRRSDCVTVAMCEDVFRTTMLECEWSERMRWDVLS
jgi:hypothetical protein